MGVAAAAAARTRAPDRTSYRANIGAGIDIDVCVMLRLRWRRLRWRCLRRRRPVVPSPRIVVDWLALLILPALPLLQLCSICPPCSVSLRPTPTRTAPHPCSAFAFRAPLVALMPYPHNANVLSRFNKLLYVVDTCQANTMFSKFYSPNIISTGSSSLGENSYSVSDRTHRTQTTLPFRLATNTRDHEECSPSVAKCRPDPC